MHTRTQHETYGISLYDFVFFFNLCNFILSNSLCCRRVIVINMREKN